jgi:PAS domain S-box-containing protein
VSSVQQAFPDCACAVRLIDPQTGRLIGALAHGALLPGARDKIEISEEMMRRSGLSMASLPPGVGATRTRQAVFHKGARGISVPLVGAEGLVGLLDVEATGKGRPPGPRALAILLPLAPQAAAALRNAQLISELKSVKRYLENLIERANALILVADGARRIQVFNQAFCDLSGRRREDVIGRDLVDLVPAQDRRKLVRAMAESLRGHPIDHLEIGLLTADARQVRVSMNTSALVSSDGAIEGLIAIGEDLTRFRELERRVIHAEKLSSLGRLAAGVVHELNNPLTSIIVSAESLRSRFSLAREITDPDRDKVARILDASQRILRFTSDLLAYARPAPAEAAPVEVSDLVGTALQFCEHVLRETSAQVELRIEEGLPRLWGVRSNLLQILVNLLTNACHAMGKPGCITIEAFGAGDQVALRVRDEGGGIPRDDLHRIFEPFFTTKPGGTGLGLSIVQGIVVQHGGALEVESELGRGTAITVRLPTEPAR